MLSALTALGIEHCEDEIAVTRTRLVNVLALVLGVLCLAYVPLFLFMDLLPLVVATVGVSTLLFAALPLNRWGWRRLAASTMIMGPSVAVYVYGCSFGVSANNWVMFFGFTVLPPVLLGSRDTPALALCSSLPVVACLLLLGDVHLPVPRIVLQGWQLQLFSTSVILTAFSIVFAASFGLVRFAEGLHAKQMQRARQLDDANAQLDQTNETLRSTNIQLGHDRERLEQFSGIVAHDLRAPLRNIRSLTRIVREDYADRPLDSQGRRLLNTLDERAEHLQGFVYGLLEYAKSASQGSSVLTQVDAHRALELALENLAGTLRESSASISSGPLPLVWANAAALQTVLQNLISNALAHPKPGLPPNVTISCRSRGDCWVIAVRDQGTGIAREDLERIFEPFQRGQAVKRPGFGLGLTACRQIAERLHGELRVESVEGEGATFELWLPKQLQDRGTQPEKVATG